MAAFQVEQQSEGAEVVQHPAAAQNAAAVNIILLALKALSQRAVIAFASLFTLLTVLSVWWLWTMVPNPNPEQLIGLGMYALFILAINWVAKGGKRG